MSYKEQLQNNNLSLQEILNTINELPEAGGGSGSSFGKRLYSFGVLSDIHLRWGTGGPGTSNYNYRNGIDDFKRAIPVLQNLGVNFVCISGDVGYDSKTEELSELYKPIIDELAIVPFYACKGNHDYSHSDETWNAYLGHSLNHVFTYEGDVFIFISMNQDSSNATNLQTPYGEECITWLKEQFALYQGARIFVFMHYPLYPYAGLRDGTTYGYAADSTEDDEILSAALTAKNVVIFNGHTHYKFDCEATYDTINTYNFQHKKVTLVHVPSSAYPRNASHSEVADDSEGYVVEVYEKGFILRGVNLATGSYMPDYEYAYTADNNPIIVDSASIILSTNSITLESGESIDVEVSLSKPINITVNIFEDNDYISVSPASLEFTEDDSGPKIFTITAGTVNASSMSAVTVSAGDLTPKTVSVALKYESEEETVVAVPQGQNIPGDCVIYGGECGASDVIYQLYDNKVAGDFEFGFRNLSLKSSQTALYFAASSSIANITLEGTNTIDISNASSLGQRGISSSGTMGNYLTGVGENAELIIKGDPDAKTEVIKGNWVIENAKVVAAGTAISGCFLVETVTPATDGEPAGITLRRSGEFSFGEITSDFQILPENIATVKLLPCENGYVEVRLGSAEPGVASLYFDLHVDDNFEPDNFDVFVNGTMLNPIDMESGLIKMPALGETMIVQGIIN